MKLVVIIAIALILSGLSFPFSTRFPLAHAVTLTSSSSNSNTNSPGATVDASSILEQTTSIQLASGSQLYIYGFATGGCCPTGDFQHGQYVAVDDLAGFRIAALAVTTNNANSYPSQTAYNTIGGVGVSNYDSYTSSYQRRSAAGPYLSVSDAFTVTSSNTLAVIIAIGGGSQCQQLSGVPGLQTDANTANLNPIITIAHAYLGSGSYTATASAQQCAAGQDPNHAGDIIGVFLFVSNSQNGPNDSANNANFSKEV